MPDALETDVTLGFAETTEKVVDATPDVQSLTRLFAESFDSDAIGPDDDFFDLGGDSLIAERLITAVGMAFGVSIPVSTLMEKSTPRLLVAAVAEAQKPMVERALVAIRPVGTGPALFCVHGTSGASMFPVNLARRIDGPPVYELRALGLVPGEVALASVEAMASRYVREIRTAQPHGPYFLVGQCDPAVVALEMAQQLLAAGEPVAGLILVDPPIEVISAPWLTQSGLKLSLARTQSRNQANIHAAAVADPQVEGDHRKLALELLQGCLAGAYTPKPFAGPALLICSSERRATILNADRGIQKLLGDLRVFELDGDHDAVFRRHFADAADAIRTFLEEVRPA